MYTQPDANALATGALVDARLEELSQYFPDDMAYQVSYDTTRYVSTAIDQVTQVITGGQSSLSALSGSTEEAQFTGTGDDEAPPSDPARIA